MEQKVGLKKDSVIAGLIVAFWLCITLVILGAFNIKEGWPAFLTLLFFFETGARTENLKNIFVGAAVGILLGAALFPLAGALISVLGHQMGVLAAVFIVVFLLIALGSVSPTFHMLFNNYAFCYFTVAMIFPKQATLEWLGVLILGGLFFTGGILYILKFLQRGKNHAVEKAA